MNMPTASFSTLSSGLPDDTPPPYSGPRRLDDDVFQTAEEAVLVEGQGNSAFLPPSAASAAASARARGGRRQGLPFTHAVRELVAARPCQSALLAAAAGALAMMVLRPRLRGLLPTRPARLR
jgi:hypothetical protein